MTALAVWSLLALAFIVVCLSARRRYLVMRVERLKFIEYAAVDEAYPRGDVRRYGYFEDTYLAQCAREADEEGVPK